MHDVVILSGARTAIGDFGGSLKDIAPWELGRIVIAAAIRRARIAPQDVGHVVLGQVSHCSSLRIIDRELRGRCDTDDARYAPCKAIPANVGAFIHDADSARCLYCPSG